MSLRATALFSILSVIVIGTGISLVSRALFTERYEIYVAADGPAVFPDAPGTAPPVLTIEVPATDDPTEQVSPKAIISTGDIGSQQPLAQQPQLVKAIYATGWSAGSTKKMDYLIGLMNETEINAIVIDIKDFSGYVNYDTDLALVEQYQAEEIRIPKLNALLKRLHDANIYAIARLSVFQDPRLALARPDLALMSSSTKQTWTDHKGLSWIDAASQEAWDYNIAIAREAFERGFDEVNFDYIRFASDGDLSDIRYPFWDETTLKTRVIKDFWQYVRERLPNQQISADLFGLTTVNSDGLGIGQYLEYAFDNFNAIAPMVYPSHYASGAFGITKPAQHPYEVVYNSMHTAVKRHSLYATKQGTSTPAIASFRPWLQDFDLGADYTADMVRAQITAVYDAGCPVEPITEEMDPSSEDASTTLTATEILPARTEPCSEAVTGWMLWNPSNIYTREALLAAPPGN